MKFSGSFQLAYIRMPWKTELFLKKGRRLLIKINSWRAIQTFQGQLLQNIYPLDHELVELSKVTSTCLKSVPIVLNTTHSQTNEVQ